MVHTGGHEKTARPGGGTMRRRRKERRRPSGRDRWELRAPGHVRPTVHPNPAGANQKSWAGVMCVPPQAREEQGR